MSDLSPYIAQRTTSNGLIPLTRLPWRLQGHLDFEPMKEYENWYIHDPTGALMSVHFVRTPRCVEQRFSWCDRPFENEEALIEKMLKSKNNAEWIGLDMERMEQ